MPASRAADPLFSWTAVEDALDAAVTADPVGNPRDEPSDRRYRLCFVRDLSDGSVPVILDVAVAVPGLVHGRLSPLSLPMSAEFPRWVQATRSGAHAGP